MISQQTYGSCGTSLLMPVRSEGHRDKFKTVIHLSELKNKGDNGFPPDTTSQPRRGFPHAA